MNTTIYTIQEVADYLKCTTKTLRNMIKSKKIRHFRVGSAIRFTEEMINDYIEATIK